MHCAHRNPAVPPSFDSAMIVRDSLVHEVDVTRFLFDEEIASIQIIKPAANPRCATRACRIRRSRSCGPRRGKHVDVELFVTTGVAYEVRTEVVGELGSAMIGLDVGLVRKVAPGTGAGRSPRLPRALRPGLRHRVPALGRRGQVAASTSTGRPRGTATPPRRCARPASGRSRPASASMSSWRIR